jgi:hypothetical protein
LFLRVIDRCFEVELHTGRRILFLDDDPKRGIEFLTANPGALWVETAADCIRSLHEQWDEVHLDHDLEGGQFVDQDRDDCGMAVVRWLCAQPRSHLQAALFVIHTHNVGAALNMMFQLESMGYAVEQRPFGAPEMHSDPRRPAWIARVGRMLARLLTR